MSHRLCRCDDCGGPASEGRQVLRRTFYRHAQKMFPDLPRLGGDNCPDDNEEDMSAPLQGHDAITATLYELILLKENHRLANKTLTGLLVWMQPLAVLYCLHHCPGEEVAFPKDWQAVDKMMKGHGMPVFEIYVICYCGEENFFLFRPKDRIKSCPYCNQPRNKGTIV
jgi:hypothetical protein